VIEQASKTGVSGQACKAVAKVEAACEDGTKLQTQEFLEFYIVLYSPHSPHRVPGKVPHFIVLSSTIDSTMECTIGCYGHTMGELQ